MRCFIAIPLSEELKQQIQGLQMGLKETEADVKWVNAESLHLTLRFLGEMKEEKVRPITEELGKKIGEFAHFEAKIEKMGTFPSLSSPRVIWIGIGKNEDRIVRLQGEIEELIVSLGFPEERRPFHPHLTLGRVRSQKNIDELTKKLRSSQLPEFKPLEVEKIILFQSILRPQGAQYKVLGEFDLKA